MPSLTQCTPLTPLQPETEEDRIDYQRTWVTELMGGQDQEMSTTRHPFPIVISLDHRITAWNRYWPALSRSGAPLVRIKMCCPKCKHPIGLHPSQVDPLAISDVAAMPPPPVVVPAPPPHTHTMQLHQQSSSRQ